MIVMTMVVMPVVVVAVVVAAMEMSMSMVMAVVAMVAMPVVAIVVPIMAVMAIAAVVIVAAFDLDRTAVALHPDGIGIGGRGSQSDRSAHNSKYSKQFGLCNEHRKHDFLLGWASHRRNMRQIGCPSPTTARK
jgi:hypothetical protein